MGLNFGLIVMLKRVVNSQMFVVGPDPNLSGNNPKAIFNCDFPNIHVFAIRFYNTDDDVTIISQGALSSGSRTIVKDQGIEFHNGSTDLPRRDSFQLEWTNVPGPKAVEVWIEFVEEIEMPDEPL